MKEAIEKVKVLMEALPYMRRFRGKLVVIKYGGSVISDEERKKDMIQDVVFMSFVGIRPFLIHGGGPAISEALKVSGRSSEFVRGLRVTDKQTLSVVRKVVARVNRDLVSLIAASGGRATGYGGKEKTFIKAKKYGGKLGYVGKVMKLDFAFQDMVKSEEISIPVVAPLALGENGELLNVNADEVAAVAACSEPAEKIVLITDVPGIVVEKAGRRKLISTLKVGLLEEMIEKHVISGGMVPKVRACVKALKAGVRKAHIIDGKIPHGLLLEIFTDKGIGTEIVK